MSRTLIRTRLVIAAIAAGFLLSAVPAPATAEASHYSWIHNKRAKYTCFSWYPGTRGCTKWLPNGSKFFMNCYTDFRWYKGNYWSNRWFYGQPQSGGWGYVHSSYVYYQKRVPRCRR